MTQRVGLMATMLGFIIGSAACKGPKSDGSSLLIRNGRAMPANVNHVFAKLNGCTATVIGHDARSTYLVSALHCVVDHAAQGLPLRSKNDVELPATADGFPGVTLSVEPKDILTMKDASAKYTTDVVALRVPLQERFRKRAIPRAELAVKDPGSGLIAAFGYGQTSAGTSGQLMETTLQANPDGIRKKTFNAVVTPYPVIEVLPLGFGKPSLATGSADNGMICKGDSGGPGLYEGKIIGVATLVSYANVVCAVPNGSALEFRLPDDDVIKKQLAGRKVRRTDMAAICRGLGGRLPKVEELTQQSKARETIEAKGSLDDELWFWTDTPASQRGMYQVVGMRRGGTRTTALRGDGQATLCELGVRGYYAAFTPDVLAAIAAFQEQTSSPAADAQTLPPLVKGVSNLDERFDPSGFEATGWHQWVCERGQDGVFRIQLYSAITCKNGLGADERYRNRPCQEVGPDASAWYSELLACVPRRKS